MAIKINLGAYALQNNETLTQRIQFIYSPLNELFRSLHVLLNPRHHGVNIDWALTARQRLSSNFFNDLHYFSLIYELGVPPILLNNFESLAPDLDTEIDQLRIFLDKADPNVILANLKKVASSRENQFIPTLAKSLEWQGFEINHSQNLLVDLADNPTSVYQHLLTFIAKYRAAVFDETWEVKSLAQVLLTEIKQLSLFLQQHGFTSLVNHLQIDRMFWRQNQLVIVKPFEETISLTDQDTILLVPSYFIWPHLFVDHFSHGIALCYSASNKPTTKISPDHIAIIFNALSDVTRLKIMKYLANQPSTTQALGQILMMSDSTISHHLKLLKDASLVTTTKKGKFVLYSPTKVVNELVPDFYTYLENKEDVLNDNNN